MATRLRMRRALSEKIRDGIRRAKEAGKRIGTNGAKLAELHKQQALERAARSYPIVEEFRASGQSYRKMVSVLNGRGEPTPSGNGVWHVRTLQRLVQRVALLPSR